MQFFLYLTNFTVLTLPAEILEIVVEIVQLNDFEPKKFHKSTCQEGRVVPF